MGVDMQATTREEGSNDLPEGLKEVKQPTSPPPTASSSSSKPAPPPAPAAEEEPMEEDDEEAQARKDATAAKQAGAEAYKKRDFDEAIKQFERAWDVWPKDITYLTNLAGSYHFQPCVPGSY